MRYVFSTGDEIDSMYMSGYTADSYKADSVGKTFIWFFPADSVPRPVEYDSTMFNHQPAVIARAENNGIFIAQNLKPIPYRVYAFEDTNNNMEYEPSVDRARLHRQRVQPCPHARVLDMVRLAEAIPLGRPAALFPHVYRPSVHAADAVAVRAPEAAYGHALLRLARPGDRIYRLRLDTLRARHRRAADTRPAIRWRCGSTCLPTSCPTRSRVRSHISSTTRSTIWSRRRIR